MLVFLFNLRYLDELSSTQLSGVMRYIVGGGEGRLTTTLQEVPPLTVPMPKGNVSLCDTVTCRS